MKPRLREIELFKSVAALRSIVEDLLTGEEGEYYEFIANARRVIDRSYDFDDDSDLMAGVEAFEPTADESRADCVA